MHVHVCICMHVYMCGVHPDTPTLPPTHHTPQNQGVQITKNSINHEWIEIYQFCLKICGLWTLLHLYRLGLVCRWRGVPSQIAFFYFGPKKCMFFIPMSPQIKVFLFLHWILIDHVYVTNDMIYDLLTHLQPFEIWPEMETKVQNLTKMWIFP